jgi:transcriptional regulator with XRE-family HTH domain
MAVSVTHRQTPLIVGGNIARMRRQRNWRQRDLADLVGVDERQVRRWENGEWMPNEAHFTKLVEVSGWPRPWFYDEGERP